MRLDREVRLEDACRELPIAVDELRDPREVIVDVALEWHRLARDLVELGEGEERQDLTLGDRRPP